MMPAAAAAAPAIPAILGALAAMTGVTISKMEETWKNMSKEEREEAVNRIPGIGHNQPPDENEKPHCKNPEKRIPSAVQGYMQSMAAITVGYVTSQRVKDMLHAEQINREKIGHPCKHGIGWINSS